MRSYHFKNVPIVLELLSLGTVKKARDFGIVPTVLTIPTENAHNLYM